jgi:hypothetical protein
MGVMTIQTLFHRVGLGSIRQDCQANACALIGAIVLLTTTMLQWYHSRSLASYVWGAVVPNSRLKSMPLSYGLTYLMVS